MSSVGITNPAGGEERALGRFGYPQELKRVLRQFSLFAIAFSIISITTGIFLNFGFGITNFGTSMIWLWIAAAIGQMLVALVLAELSTHIPLAGANYQWGTRLVSPDYGWFVGALGFVYNTVSMPGIMLVGAAPLTATLFGWNTGNERLLLFIGLVLLVAAFAINIISIQLAARVNNLAVITEILGAVLFAVLVFVFWVAGGKSTTHDGHTLHFLFAHNGNIHQSVITSIMLAALIGIYTIVGFETTADMSEEAVDARRTVPQGMIRAVGLAGVLGMVVLIGFTVAIPNLAKVQASSTPLVTISEYWLGDVMSKVLIALVVFSMFALVVAQSAANARLMFAMARDNMMPGSRWLRKVNLSTQTPIVAILVGLVVSIALMIYGYEDGNAFGTLIGAASIAPYVVYLLTVIAYGIRRGSLEPVPDGFHLGRWSKPVFIGAFVWLVLALCCLCIPSEFRNAVYVTLGAVVLAALWYVVALRARLRSNRAGPDSVLDGALKSAPVVVEPGPSGSE